MSSDGADYRELAPPPGFVVMRSSEIDPLSGCSDRWAYHGEFNGRAMYACGHKSREAAYRAAWEAVGHA